jgi:hypothetical protein
VTDHNKDAADDAEYDELPEDKQALYDEYMSTSVRSGIMNRSWSSENSLNGIEMYPSSKMLMHTHMMIGYLLLSVIR